MNVQFETKMCAADVLDESAMLPPDWVELAPMKTQSRKVNKHEVVQLETTPMAL